MIFETITDKKDAVLAQTVRDAGEAVCETINDRVMVMLAVKEVQTVIDELSFKIVKDCIDLFNFYRRFAKPSIAEKTAMN